MIIDGITANMTPVILALIIIVRIQYNVKLYNMTTNSNMRHSTLSTSY